MALVTTLKFVMTWAFANAIFLIFAGIEKFVAYDTGLWNLMPSDMLAYQDQLYALWFAQIIIIPAIIIITAWREAERKAITG